MHKTFLAIVLGLLASMAVAQQRADIIVSYQESWRDWQSDTLKTVGMTLLANNNESKYFNDLSLWSDSLSSTPDGKAQLQQIIMAACMTQHPDGSISVDLRKGPVKKVDTYVFSNLADATITCYDKFAGELCCYTEPRCNGKSETPAEWFWVMNACRRPPTTMAAGGLPGSHLRYLSFSGRGNCTGCLG